MSKNLVNHPYSNCYVRINPDGSIDFISYTTRVISIVFDGLRRMVECTGTYSMTTAKQISWFLREYAPDLCLSDMKKIIGCGLVAC